MSDTKNKVVVFDLDETLGQFDELGIFCDAMEKYNKRKLNFEEFYKIMDTYPEFIRPNIIKILLYIKNKKLKGECNKVMIYTNNQGPREWAENIKQYFEKKIKYNLFDQVIAAYKVNGRITEERRTSHDKSVNDLFNCANLSENTKVCFLDDVYHPLMENNDVYYINVKPYTNSIQFKEMASRYYDNNSDSITDKEKFTKFIINQMNKYNYKVSKKTIDNNSDDITMSKNIIYHLHNFFKTYKKSKTQKIRSKKKKSRGGTRKSHSTI